MNLHSTISDFSAGAISGVHQNFYNFVHGRPFQSSLYASDESGISVGFSHNPHAYIHWNVYHVHYTPYLLVPLWAIWPNLYWLYSVGFFFTYIGMAYFSWKIIQTLSPHSAKVKTVLALALLLSSGFFFTLQQKAQPLLVCGPFILAAYYCLLRKRGSLFLVTTCLLCLVSEDTATVVLCFAAYLFIFEPDRKAYAYKAATISAFYLALALFVIQPAARHDLVMTETTTFAFVIKQLRNVSIDHLQQFPLRILPVLFFAPAFAIVYLVFGKSSFPSTQLAGLAVVSPFLHWGISIASDAAHHLMPVAAFVYLAFLLMLGRTVDVDLDPPLWSSRQIVLALVLMGLFVLGNLRVISINIPNDMRLIIYDQIGKRAAAHKLTESFSEISGNKRVIAVAQSIPPQHSLVFLTNSTVEGFIAGRSDLWQFPHQYDVSDFLILQRNAHQSFFSFLPPLDGDLQAALRHGRFYDEDNAVITRDMVQSVTNHLVIQARTHRLVVDEPDVVLLERIEKQPFVVPSSTVGFGWIRNLMRRS